MIYRCDGCGAKFPHTPEGAADADRHIALMHPTGLWTLHVVGWMLAGFFLYIAWQGLVS